VCFLLNLRFYFFLIFCTSCTIATLNKQTNSNWYINVNNLCQTLCTRPRSAKTAPTSWRWAAPAVVVCWFVQRCLDVKTAARASLVKQSLPPTTTAPVRKRSRSLRRCATVSRIDGVIPLWGTMQKRVGTIFATGGQARSYIGIRGHFPPDGCFAPLYPKRPTCNFFLHINFPSPVSLDAQM